MSKTTTVTTSYTSDIIVNGTAIPADKIYANGTQVKRCLVNGTDVIHKFTRTVVTSSSNLTFLIQVSFRVDISTLCGYSDYVFSSPIYVDVTVTDNGSSGFTYVAANTRLTFFCPRGDEGSASNRYYQQSLSNQVFMLGQTTRLEFYYFEDKYIDINNGNDHITPSPTYDLYFDITDPDGVSAGFFILNYPYNSETFYSKSHSIQRAINSVISETTVQEY